MSPIKKLGKKSPGRSSVVTKQSAVFRKQSPAASPQQNTISDIDFDYVQDLTPHYQRIAVFYEYARHSRELTEAIKRLRCVWRTPEGDKIWERLEILPDSPNFLPFCREFPEKPFKDAINFVPWDKSEPFGVILPRTESLGELFASRRALLPQLPFDSSGDERFEALGSKKGDVSITKHVISIPWCYTNAELSKMIGKLIPALRPGNCPEPRKAGRAGRSHDINIRDMLKQLIVYRLDSAGVTFDKANRPDGTAYYTTKEGWNKGVKAAHNRIRGMLRRPFF